MAYQEGDTSPPHINVHNEVVTQVQELADARNVDVILPPQRNIGDTEHVKDHNLITDALAAVAAAGGGKVLQVEQTEYNTVKEVASTTYTDAGGSVTITPTDATSDVLVTMDLSLHISCTTNDDVYGYVAMYRNGVSIKDFSNVNRVRAATGLGGMTHVTTRTTVSFLDSPNTTSPCTYTARIKVNNTADSRKIIAQTLNSPSTYTALEIAQ